MLAKSLQGAMRVSTIGLLFMASLLCASSPVDRYVAPETPIWELPFLLKKMRAPLSPQDEAKCLDYIRFRFDDTKAMSGRVLQNDLADWLLKSPAHATVTTQALLDVIADEEADLFWREFCVQKLAQCIENSAISDQDLKMQCEDVLVAMVSNTQISFSGTALIGLYNLSKNGLCHLSAKDIIQMAQLVYTSADYATANQVSALQVAGLLGSEHAMQVARDLVQSRSTPIQLRTSGLSLLGQKGMEDDLDIIRLYANDSDYRIRTAARAAEELIIK